MWGRPRGEPAQQQSWDWSPCDHREEKKELSVAKCRTLSKAITADWNFSPGGRPHAGGDPVQGDRAENPYERLKGGQESQHKQTNKMDPIAHGEKIKVLQQEEFFFHLKKF